MTWGEGGLPNLLQNYNRQEGCTETPNLYYVINGQPLMYIARPLCNVRGE